jgi:hypothetical protein
MDRVRSAKDLARKLMFAVGAVRLGQTRLSAHRPSRAVT